MDNAVADEPATTPPAPTPAPAPAPAPAPRSWAELVKTALPGGSHTKALLPKVNGSLPVGKTTLANVLKSFDATKYSVPVIEPRGLVNTGNMCYMNAVSCSFDRVYSAC